jgi:hypothetical protein
MRAKNKKSRKREKIGGRKGQIVFSCNNGAVASPVMRREPVRS